MDRKIKDKMEGWITHCIMELPGVGDPNLVLAG